VFDLKGHFLLHKKKMEKKGVKETDRQTDIHTDIHTVWVWTLYICYHTNFAEASNS